MRSEIVVPLQAVEGASEHFDDLVHRLRGEGFTVSPTVTLARTRERITLSADFDRIGHATLPDELRTHRLHWRLDGAS